MIVLDELQNYINTAAIIPQAKIKNKSVPALFLFAKPKEVEADTFVIIQFRQLQSAIQHLSVELKIYSKDLVNLYDLRHNLITLLDFKRRKCEIPKIQKFVFANEGGVYYNDNDFYFADSLTFDCFAKNII